MRNQELVSRPLVMSDNIESQLIENRVFKPGKGQYQEVYRKFIKNPESFWSQQASELLVWPKKWRSVLEWEEPFAKWFVGGKLNVSENCLDRHLTSSRRNKAALGS